VRENVKAREQELAKCNVMIAERTLELMKRFVPRPSPASVPRPNADPDWGLAPAVVCPSYA
jgi:hypothetical protein